MTNYKIKRNQPDLTDEQINRHKDFSKVLATHQKVLKYKDATKPLYKNPGFMGLIMLLSVVLLVFTLTDKEPEAENTQKDTSSVPAKTLPAPKKMPEENLNLPDSTPAYPGEEALNVPPQEGFRLPQISFQKLKIDGVLGGIVYTGSTRILVPPYAFTDRDGKPVETTVELHYRELHDPASLFLAGISMETSSKDPLKITSMFELRGFAGQQQVKLKEALTVELAAPSHKNHLTYLINESSGKWESLGPESISMRFFLQANDKDFPELKPFKDILWEFVTDNPEEYNHIFSKTWSKFFLDEKLMPAPTNVRLKQHASEPKFVVRPVAISGNKDFNKELVEAKYNEYYEALKKKDKDTKLLEEAQRKQQAWLSSPPGQEYLKWNKSTSGQKHILSSRIVSVFSVNRFGVWASGTSYRPVKETNVTASYRDQSGKKLNLSEVYLVDYDVNLLFNYPASSFRFNPDSKNILWSVLPDGKLALFTSDRFKSLPPKGEAVLTMKVIDIKGKTEAEIRAILEMKLHISSKEAEKDKDPVGTYERKVVMKKEIRSEAFYSKDEKGKINKNFKTEENGK